MRMNKNKTKVMKVGLWRKRIQLQNIKIVEEIEILGMKIRYKDTDNWMTSLDKAKLCVK